MRIDHLELTNFRCFEKFALDLHPEFNVLVGRNGTGKTALLDALAIAAGAWFLGIRSGGGEPREIHIEDVRFVAGDGPRNGRKSTTFEPQYPVDITAVGMAGEYKDTLTWSRLKESEQAATRVDTSFSLQVVAHNLDMGVRSFEKVVLPIIAYYGAGRLWLPVRTSKFQDLLTRQELSRFEGYRHSLEARTQSGDLERWLAYEDRMSYADESPSPVYRAVLEAMRRMYPEAHEVRYDPKRLEVVVETNDGTVRPYRQLSDGQRNLLALGGDIAMRMARLNPDLGDDVLTQTPGIVLIDELDLHLHPAWQREVVQRLRDNFPRVQFVTTTHSPQIISEAPPECVRFLDLGSNEATQRPQTYGFDTNSILEYLMDAPSRPAPVQELIDHTDDAIEAGNLDEARAVLADLRRTIHGEDGEVARLEAEINNLEALADAVD